MSWGGRKVRRLAQLVVETYGNRCAKCLGYIDLTLTHPHPRRLSVGHQLPRSRGGSDDISNLRPEHLRCNLAAGDRLGPSPTARPWDVPDQPDPTRPAF